MPRDEGVGGFEMKIVVTAAEPSLDGAVDPRFGRCPYFVIVETEDLAFEAVENPNVTLGGGAGIQSAQLMNEKGVRFVLTGNCGPNAHRTLLAAGIEVIVGCSGLVQDVVEKFKEGRLVAADEPNVAGHFGTADPPPDSQAASSQQPPAMEASQQPSVIGIGMGRGGGQRGGIGRGMGRGGGRGRGMGRGMGGGGVGAGAWPPAPMPKTIFQPPQSIDKQEELRLLKQQAEATDRQMQEIRERIRQLEEEEGA
jgi:predicted Fe-Mo cluster-binding NifX family protein